MQDYPEIMFALGGAHLKREMMLTISFLMWEAGIYCTQKMFLDFLARQIKNCHSFKSEIYLT